MHENNLPIINEKGMCLHYGLPHENFVWGVRSEPGVTGAFEKIYDDEDLIVSFDAINFQFPKYDLMEFHVQLSSFFNNLIAVQTSLRTSLGLIRTRTPRSTVFAACKVSSISFRTDLMTVDSSSVGEVISSLNNSTKRWQTRNESLLGHQNGTDSRIAE